MGQPLFCVPLIPMALLHPQVTTILHSPRIVPQKQARICVTMPKNQPKTPETAIVPQKSLHFCGTMRVRSGESPRKLVLDLIQPYPPLLITDLLDHVEADPSDVVDTDLVECTFDE